MEVCSELIVLFFLKISAQSAPDLFFYNVMNLNCVQFVSTNHSLIPKLAEK